MFIYKINERDRKRTYRDKILMNLWATKNSLTDGLVIEVPTSYTKDNLHPEELSELAII